MLKICGARGPVCLPHAVPVSGSKLCPTKWRPATFAHLNLWMWEPVNCLSHMLASLILKKKARASWHLGVTEWCAGRRAGCQKATTEFSLKKSQSLSHLCYPTDTRQPTSPQGEADGVSDRGMMLQALGGVNSPCCWYRIRGQLPSTGGWEHTHRADPQVEVQIRILLKDKYRKLCQKLLAKICFS